MASRILRWGLVALLIFTLIPAAHAAEMDDYLAEYDDFAAEKFLIEDSVLSLYTGTDNNITIPNGVKTIGYYAFDGNASLTSIAIPDGVTTIETGAFSRCTALKSVTLPNSLTSIGSNAFQGCTSLTDVHIPESVETIYNGAFQGCSGMKEFTVDAKNKTYSSENGVLYYNDDYDNILLYYPAQKSDSSFVIPNSVLSVGEYAFAENKNLKSVILGTGVRQIGSYAFANCGLTSVSLGKSITEIDFAPFYNCKSLTEIVVDPNNPLYSSENGVLYHNGINEARKTTLSVYPAGKKDTAFTVPDSVKNIEPLAFYGNGYLMALTIGKNVTMAVSIDACPALTLYGEAESYAEIFAIEYNIPFVAGKAPPSGSLVLKAVPTYSAVLVNGNPVSFDAYTINQSNYFKLRDLAYVLSGTSAQFNVVWSSESNAIKLISSQPYSVAGGELTGGGAGAKTPFPNTTKIILDNLPISLSGYIIDGSSYFKLRDIASLFYFTVEWDATSSTIIINTGDA